MKKVSPRFIVPAAISLLGVIGIAAVRTVFAANDPGEESVMHDDFMLFFKASLIVSAVMLFFITVSMLSSVSRGKAPSVLHTAVAPVICACGILAATLLYSYLTGGSAVSIKSYVICLGIGEILVFALPAAIAALFKEKKEK